MPTLKEHIREAAGIAEQQCMQGDFNAMSWLDLTLEEIPESFDSFFDIAWNELSENGQQERINAIRKVL